MNHSRDGVEVLDTNADVMDLEETNRVDPPQVINDDDVLEWEISNPKLTYKYFVYFSCQ